MINLKQYMIRFKIHLKLLVINFYLKFMKAFKFIMLLFISYNINAQKNIKEKLLEIAIIDEKVMMPMRDGIRLSTDVYRPKGNKKVPIIFSRTPYNFNTWQNEKEVFRTMERAYEAIKHGYAYVVQNERGRYFSEGQWDILGVPLTDGYDAFSWMSKQAWSNGKIGTLGCSSTAEWQMAVAALDHPSHAAMVPQGFGAGIGTVGEYFEQGNWYRGGAEQLLFPSWLYSVEHDKFKPRIPEGASQEDLIRISRFYDLAPENPPVDWIESFKHLPLQDLLKNVNGKKEIYDKMIKRKPDNDEWFKGGLYHDSMDFGVPSFWFVSWYDVSVSPNIALFNHVRNTAKEKYIRDNQYLVIAPTLHCGFTRATENTIVGERSMGDARLNYEDQIYDWFDYLLKREDNNFKIDTPKVQYFTMGKNIWQASDTWPPEKAIMKTLYLQSNGIANSRLGDGTLSFKKDKRGKTSDIFLYDPMNPIESYGGGVCCTGNAVEGGSFDQQKMEENENILVYTSEPFSEGVEVTGFIESTLYLSSDVKDTDLTIKLIDVYPDGASYNLDETIQRVRYREGYDKEIFMDKGEVYEVSLTPMATSNFFKKGHSVRIEVSSSNFPRFARNLNTGGNNYDEIKSVIAKNRIHHSTNYPSKIRLPFVYN